MENEYSVNCQNAITNHNCFMEIYLLTWVVETYKGWKKS